MKKVYNRDTKNGAKKWCVKTVGAVDPLPGSEPLPADCVSFVNFKSIVA